MPERELLGSGQTILLIYLRRCLVRSVSTLRKETPLLLENDESQWSRRGQSLVESNSLRRDLMAMEKRSDRTTIKDVYNNFMGWLQEEKGMSREDVLKADAMACSTFGRWYGEQKQELSTNKRWRENIAAYIAHHSSMDGKQPAKRGNTE